MKTYKHISLGLFAVCMLCTSCQDKEWDNYYGSGEDNGLTLMQTIDANSNLSSFAAVVRQNGLESLLTSSQSLTVFAPDNNAMASLETSNDVLQQFLYNHQSYICSFHRKDRHQR